MLELRPNCELCDVDLPPSASTAMICTYECTFCVACVDKLSNVCPNCGGGFSPRPVRPVNDWREGLSLSHQPGSKNRVNSKYKLADLQDFVEAIKSIAPKDR